MKKLLWLGLILFLSTGVSQAQSPIDEPFSILYLKDGSVYIGEIQDKNANPINLRLSTGNNIEIDRFFIRKYLFADDVLLYDNGKYHVTRGPFFNFSFGINAALSDEKVSNHMSFMYGYNFNKKFAVAAGLAFEFNEAILGGFFIDTQFLPIFAYGRYYLSDNRRRPFVYSRIGYGMADNNNGFTDHGGGFQFQSGFGFHFASKKRTHFLLKLGYHLQNTQGSESFIDQFGNEIRTDYDLLIKRWILTFSWDFNKTNKFR